MDSERKEFEAKYPMPVNAIWVGGRYAATEYDAWDVQTHQARWEGWQARAEQSRAECEALRLKAARYDWLRSGVRERQGMPIPGAGSRRISKDELRCFMEFSFWCEPDELDKQIDAAMGKEKA